MQSGAGGLREVLGGLAHGKRRHRHLDRADVGRRHGLLRGGRQPQRLLPPQQSVEQLPTEGGPGVFLVYYHYHYQYHYHYCHYSYHSLLHRTRGHGTSRQPRKGVRR
jgi:hypothetical protein